MKIHTVSSSRAEYGFLYHLVEAFDKQPDFNCSFVLSGLHVDRRTEHKVESSEAANTRCIFTSTVIPLSESRTYVADYLAASTTEFAKVFADESVDLVVLLGDRIETMGAALAAHSLRIPIAHLHGGETTLGLLDDGYRNAISKLSSLHFPSTEIHRENLIRLGEDPQRIFNVGALAVEAVRGTGLLSTEQLESLFGMPVDHLLIVTFHPVTLSVDQGLAELDSVLSALDSLDQFQIVLTAPNMDGGVAAFRQRIRDFVSRNGERARFFESLGHRQYLSALHTSVACVGNSSSGLIEAPILGVPTVDIGSRQAGRFKPSLVVSTRAEPKLIVEAILTLYQKRLEGETREIRETEFGSGNTSQEIVRIIRSCYYSNSLSKWRAMMMP